MLNETISMIFKHCAKLRLINIANHVTLTNGIFINFEFSRQKCMVSYCNSLLINESENIIKNDNINLFTHHLHYLRFT